MKLAVVGSRNFDNYPLLQYELDKIKPSLIISGGAKGADELAEVYAFDRKIPTKIFYADWETLGKTAGFLRNIKIVNECDFLIAFWDKESKGTKSSIDLAMKRNKLLRIVYF